MAARDDWQALNDRQRAYLLETYTLDQQAERRERGAWGRGARARPADVWRWIPYTGATELKRRLSTRGMVDPGTGATFEALEQRGLVQCKHERGALGELALLVRVTTRGRQAARAGTGEHRPARQPAGTLQEWQWRALARAYAAHPSPLPYDGAGHYGGIAWGTWLRLRDYRAGALVQETGTGEAYALGLTALGLELYARDWARYRELYPDVDAPAPGAKGQTL